ncbi:MAG: hypothetical protein JSU68_04150 [Phycisphaerales bacterium]|nr:MAG: hypothetical protein JSU68_04150 [Phycisphaerales bacterium]
MRLTNSTSLSTGRLNAMILPHMQGWKCDRLIVRVRWSRGAEFSGTCNYTRRVITVNLGRHNRYPYVMDTQTARPRSNRTHWWRPSCHIVLADAYQLALFVFLHELYHWLIRQARRNTRQKEGRCDRFAARVLVNEYGCPMLDAKGRPVPRAEWDFQDLYSFIEGARRKRTSARRPRLAATAPEPRHPVDIGGQGLLFPIH